jgi:alpha-1,2-mannosyltransferase
VKRISLVTIFESELWRAWWPRLVFMASATTLAAGAAQMLPLPLLHPLREYDFFDLRVYRDATRVVSSGRPLYRAHLKRGLGFTYPPFAVLAMLPLRWLSLFHAEEVVTFGNILLVAVAAHAAVRLSSPSGGRARAGWVAAAVALWAEPIVSTIGYGQIDLLIAALVLVDLAYGRNSRAGGIGIGLAAALKLTPLIFIPYLLFTRRGRPAGRAMATFALSILAAFIALPRDAGEYWGGAVFDVSRVTGHHHLSGGGPANQSLRGALLRFFPDMSHVSAIWLPCCLFLACLGLLLAVRVARRGNESYGFLLIAITGLLISPVSWTHHWAIVVPAVLAMVTSTDDRGTRWLLTAMAIEIAVASSAIWFVIDNDPVGTRLGTGGLLLANLYVLAGLAVLATAAMGELQRAVANRRSRGRRRMRSQPLRVIPEGVSGP